MKTKTFDRWAKKIISTSSLCNAAREIEQGLYEADLGGGVCKKRIPLRGQGKSGSIRTIVAKKNKDAIIFIVGREKSGSGSDFTNAEQEAAGIVARSFERVDIFKLRELVISGTLRELDCYA
ncbi:type II toxin-antitoxin system RelE/ParE family toxin [Polynucleobacter antarcticus]|nr:type II toxin-antitoxin system RelE/ParE family toxin [Polynucleobacter antarcticus]